MEILQYPLVFTAARRYRRVSRIWALHRRQTLSGVCCEVFRRVRQTFAAMVR